MSQYDAIVIGAGIGGLSSAILLGARGLRVLVLEMGEVAGGKAGTTTIDGVEVDTGPSVLTLPDVFDEIFQAAGLRRDSELSLTRPSPGFRYIYHDGVELDVFHDVETTLNSVHHALGSQAARDLRGYLDYAERIWNAAAPHFVYNAAPELSGVLFGGLRKWTSLAQIDPLRSLSAAIDEKVRSPHLRKLLRRYATYNGSDARSAPATLGCISHVELTLGGYGVKGGMVELVRALERAARRVGVEFRFQSPVERIAVDKAGVCGVVLAGGEVLPTRRVVANADVAHVAQELLSEPRGLAAPSSRSMSAHTGIVRCNRLTSGARPAHTVVFPEDYDAEFRDIFGHQRVPLDPTIYLCAQESCHVRSGWSTDEPVFCMINAPAMDDFSSQEPAESVRKRIFEKLRIKGLVQSQDRLVWWRTPEDLARRFPGSRGSLYGSSSNSMTAAFARPPNRAPRTPGLYLASGSAHPGGGVPMVALSGKQAARALLDDQRRQAA